MSEQQNGITYVLSIQQQEATFQTLARPIQHIFGANILRRDLPPRLRHAAREVTMALTRYFSFYNERRVHQNLDYQTPDEMYFGTGKMENAA